MFYLDSSLCYTVLLQTLVPHTIGHHISALDWCTFWISFLYRHHNSLNNRGLPTLTTHRGPAYERL